jgi:hypothetical protein
MRLQKDRTHLRQLSHQSLANAHTIFLHQQMFEEVILWYILCSGLSLKRRNTLGILCECRRGRMGPVCW